MQISKATSLICCGAAVALASNTDSNSSRIDMKGWEGVRFFTSIDDSVATGVATLKVEQNSADSDSGMAALSGASHARSCVTNDDINGKALVIDVFRPTERYVQAVRTSATANIAFGAVWAELYGPRVLPTTEDASVSGGAEVVSPAEV